MNNASLPVVQLNKGAERRIRSGHCWVYSNEIDNAFLPLKQLSAGTCATLQDMSGRTLGSAYFNAGALLCGRVYSRRADVHYDSVIGQRIEHALSWRQRAYPRPYYRLCDGDGDGLPGIVVDRYGETLVVQVTTAGAMASLDPLIEALVDQLQPRGIVLRNDAAGDSEGLEAVTRVVYGEVEPVAELVESDLAFDFPVLEGQKTGWFFDHRENRAQLKRYVQGAKVLDLYSYLGAWGLQTLAAGAEVAHFVDRSSLALEFVERNAQKQGVQNRVSTTQGNVDEVIKGLIADDERYDVIIVDPPAFIKKRKDQKRGEQAYHRINQQAVRLLAEGGLLVSASCSLHLSAQRLQEVVSLAARKRSREARLVFQGGLGADHPVLAAIPEMSYLKTNISIIGR